MAIGNRLASSGSARFAALENVLVAFSDVVHSRLFPFCILSMFHALRG